VAFVFHAVSDGCLSLDSFSCCFLVGFVSSSFLLPFLPFISFLDGSDFTGWDMVVYNDVCVCVCVCTVFLYLRNSLIPCVISTAVLKAQKKARQILGIL
jgi:hypothetical protein